MTVLHGYADNQYRRMEREGVGSTHSLIRLAKIFGISVAELLEGIGQPAIAPQEPRIATWDETGAALKRKQASSPEKQSAQKIPRTAKQKFAD